MLNPVKFDHRFEFLERSQLERNLTKKDAVSQKHHEAVMKLINDHRELIEGYKEVRNEYDKLFAQFDLLMDIVTTHLPEMRISGEEINARLDKARKAAKVTYPG